MFNQALYDGSRRYAERFDFSKNNRNVFFLDPVIAGPDGRCVHFPITRINIVGSLNS